MSTEATHPPLLDDRVREAIRRLLAAAPTGSRVFLFGSHARGEARPDSDVDLLVVEPDVQDAIAEMVRLSQAVRPLRIPVDVLVSSAEHFAYWCDTRNTIYYRVAREGRSFDAGSLP